MSGNPFRKHSATQISGPAGIAVPSKAKGKVKKVQFVSPITSPQPQEPSLHPRFPSLEELDDGLKSPPPKGLADAPDAVDTRALLRGDLTAGGAIDLKANEREEAASAASENTSQISSGFQLSQPPPGRRVAPANPFARTLATIERESSTGKSDNDPAKHTPVMDVDAFKRLLLTGKADALSEHDETVARDIGSSTDSSFISKHTDSGKNTRPETPDSPLSSLEDATSEQDSSHDGDREATEPIGRNASKMQPVTPNFSASTQRIPQTVSFDDFDFESLQPARVEEASSKPVPPARPARSGSDANKQPPVPPSPRVSRTSSILETDQSKKNSQPPPPPTSRRLGQGKPVSRSRSSSDVDAVPGTSDTAAEDLQTSGRPKPPPPRAPAARLAGRELKRPTSIADSISSMATDILPNQSMTDQPDASGNGKAKPPPPRSRNLPKQPQLPLNRTPSSSSTVAPRRASPSIAGAAPPPPPPRRGEAKRTSFDATGLAIPAPGGGDHSRRFSSHSLSVERRDSVSSLQRTSEGEALSMGKNESDRKLSVNMLADLDAFQREVDALRAKALAGK